MKLSANMDIAPHSHSTEHTTVADGLSLPFRGQSMGHFWAGTGYYTDRKDLPTYFAGYGIHGSGLLRYRGQTFSIGAGDVFFISCSEHHYYATQAAPWEFRWIHFNGSGCDSLFRIFSRGPVVFHPLEDLGLDACFNQLETLMGGSSLSHDLQLSSRMDAFLSSLCLAQSTEMQQDPAGRDIPGIALVLRHIQVSFNEPLTVAELAALAHMSPYHFIRQFHQCVGCTPYQYILQRRLEEAKRLLQTTSMSIEEIAFQVGHGSAGNLIRDFRKNTGMTPGAYRLLERGVPQYRR